MKKLALGLLLFAASAHAETNLYFVGAFNIPKLITEMRAAGVELQGDKKHPFDGDLSCGGCGDGDPASDFVYTDGQLRIRLDNDSPAKIAAVNSVVAAHVP